MGVRRDVTSDGMEDLSKMSQMCEELRKEFRREIDKFKEEIELLKRKCIDRT